MKIVFLDSSSVDLGDIDMSPLKKCGEVTLYKNSTTNQIISRAQKADVIVTNKCLLDKKFFNKFPNLKLICVAATGYNNIDLQQARLTKTAVANVPGYSTQTVVEHAILFLLAISHRLIEHHQAAFKSSRWMNSPHFALLDFPFSNLGGKTLGLVGYGSIGKNVARIAKALGMRVLVAQIPGRKYKERRPSLATVLGQSDFVSLHCPLTDLTKNLINAKSLRHFKKGASLLNLARGPLVDEMAIVAALKNKTLSYYATDVMSQEPPLKDHPFFTEKILRDKIILTPHVAWGSRESRQKLVDEMAMNIKFFLKGKKRNRVD